MTAAKNGDVIVNFDCKGSGPAILLFNHSATSNLSWSEHFLEFLAVNHTIITPDYRGTGLSSPAVKEFSLLDLASDGLAVLQMEKIERAIIVGTSMGGAVAQEFVLHYPEFVESLVLIGTFAGNKERIPAETWVDDLFLSAFQEQNIVKRWQMVLTS